MFYDPPISVFLAASSKNWLGFSKTIFALSQSPNNTSPSSGALMAGLSNSVHPPPGLPVNLLLQQPPAPSNHTGQNIPNFAAVAAQQNGEQRKLENALKRLNRYL